MPLVQRRAQQLVDAVNLSITSATLRMDSQPYRACRHTARRLRSVAQHAPAVRVRRRARPHRSRADAVVVGTVRGHRFDGVTLARRTARTPSTRRSADACYDALRALGATGKAGRGAQDPDARARRRSRSSSPPGSAQPTTDRARPSRPPRPPARRAPAAARAHADRCQRRVHLAIDAPAGALAEGALLGAYGFTAYKSAPTKPARCAPITIAARDVGAKADVRKRACRARRIGDAGPRPGEHAAQRPLPGQSFAERAAALAAERGVDGGGAGREGAQARPKFGGILGVGHGQRAPASPRPHCPTARPSAKPRTWRWSARGSPSTPAGLT